MKGDDGPLFRPSEKLDFELELVCPSDSALMQHSLYQPVTCVSHIATTESVNLNSECNEQRLCSSTANVITDMWLAGVRAGEQHLDREPSEDAASFTPHLWLHADERLLCTRHSTVGVCAPGALQRQELRVLLLWPHVCCCPLCELYIPCV